MDKGKGIMEDEIRMEGEETKEREDAEMPSWVLNLQGVLEGGQSTIFAECGGIALGRSKSDQYWNYVEPDETEPKFEKIYCPYKVSLGPLVEESSKNREDMKKANLIHFLKNSGAKADHLYEELKNDVKQLRDTYSELAPKWREDDDSFIHMMAASS